MRDLTSATTTFVAHNGHVDTSCVGWLHPAYSAVDDAIAFQTPQQLVPEDINGGLDVDVYDVPADSYSLVAVTPDGDAAGSSAAVWDPRGDRIAYLMTDVNTDPVDKLQVFVITDAKPDR